MDKQDEYQGPGKENRFKDEHTDKRIYEHLTNENDEISEEDIQKVKTDVTAPSHEPEDHVERETEAKEEPGIDTSWNILDH